MQSNSSSYQLSIREKGFKNHSIQLACHRICVMPFNIVVTKKSSAKICCMLHVIVRKNVKSTPWCLIS